MPAALNLPTVLVAAALGAILAAIIVRPIRRRKRGAGGCGCSCAGCSCTQCALSRPRERG